MRSLVLAFSLLAAGTAQAQYPTPYAPYPTPYAPYPPGYPPQQPIYIPQPGHAAQPTPGAEPGYYPPPGRPWYPPEGYAAPRSYAPPPAYPTQPYGAPPAYAQPRATPAAEAHGLLAPQNAVRARVGEPPMHWSNRLAGVARQWADHLVATGQFVHRVGDRYGENLYEITGGIASPRQVVAAWADEARDYDRRTNTCSGMCGHYTQIVWRATRAVGCAVASGGGRQVWVCEYNPPGNWVGYRPY